MTNEANSFQTYRFTGAQWAKLYSSGDLDAEKTAKIDDSDNDVGFEIFKCTGELYEPTCNAFLPAYKKDDEDGFPRFDTTDTKTVQAGVYDGSKIGGLAVRFNNITLKNGVTLKLASMALALSAYSLF